MSNFKIDKAGASAADQRKLQELILEINPDALPKYGADGAIGDETNAALKEILGADAVDSMSVEDATKILQDMVNEKALAVDAGKPVSEASADNVTRIQEMIQTIDPKALPKFGADGDAGDETMAALKALSSQTPPGIGIDLTTASIEDVVANLQGQIDALPERYVVEDCDNLTEIAREVYAEEIKEYTQQVMELNDPRFPTEKAARVHAEQVAVARIAFANDLGEGVDAHIINPGDVLDIPDAGELKASDPTLDWEALDGEVGPGGPCGCDGESPITPSPKEITSSFTPVVRNSTPAGLPSRVKLGDNCWADLKGYDRGGIGPFFQGEEKPRYVISGEELHSPYHVLKDKLQAMGHNVDIRSNGQCEFPHEGGDGTPDPVGGKTDPGLGDGPGPGGTSTL